MPYITRIHLSDCGWREAFFEGTTVALTDPRTGKPTHTVFSLENTGGKTTFLALVLSCFEPNERFFLKSLIHRNQKFGDYFQSRPAFILVEWDYSGRQGSLFNSERLVTGQLVVPRGEGQHREHDRHFFAFRSSTELSFDTLPAPGLAGFSDAARLQGPQDAQRWLHEMRTGHPGHFQSFTNQTDWKRKLAEEKIDAVLLAAQVQFNRNEGGIEVFLNFRDEAQFIREFLSMTIPDSRAERVREILDIHVRKLADRPRLLKRKDSIARLHERFGPFVQCAAVFAAAQSEAANSIAAAASLDLALLARSDRAADQAKDCAQAADGHAAAVAEAVSRRDEARTLDASATVALARLRAEAARTQATRCQTALMQAKGRAHLLNGALRLGEIETLRADIQHLQEGIDAENADLQPRRERLAKLGADLRATLRHQAARHRQHQNQLSGEAESLNKAEQVLKDERRAAIRIAGDQRREETEFRVRIETADTMREKLETAAVLQRHEPALAAAERHDRRATEDTTLSRELHQTAEIRAREASTLHDRKIDLGNERERLATECKHRSREFEVGATEQQALANQSDFLRLTGAAIDPDSDGLAAMLDNAIQKAMTELHKTAAEHARLSAERDSIDAVGLASVDRDVRAVAERLRASGIRDAQPYASWLSSVRTEPEAMRRFAAQDPAAFTGVAVPGRSELDRARVIFENGPQPHRPIVVAVAQVTPDDIDANRFVLPVEDAAAYDRKAAAERRAHIETELQQIDLVHERETERINDLGRLLHRLETWRKRFGFGQLAALRTRIDAAEARIITIAAEIGEVTQAVAECEREAAELRDQADRQIGEANRCAENARRAEEQHLDYEQYVPNWREAQSASRAAADAAESRAHDAELERHQLHTKAESVRNAAREAGSAAAQLEREAESLAHVGDTGQPTVALEALRAAYERERLTLEKLENDQTGELRGRKQEKDQRLKEQEDEFTRTFSDLDREVVKAAVEQGSVAAAAAAARNDVEQILQGYADARSAAESAERIYREEERHRTDEIRPHPLRRMSGIDAECLIATTQRAGRDAEEQERIRKAESLAERSAGEAANGHSTLSRTCRSHAERLRAMLKQQPPGITPATLPQDNEIEDRVTEVMRQLSWSRELLDTANNAVYADYDRIRRFVRSDAFEGLESEREVTAHLTQSDPLEAAAGAQRTAGLIDDRLKTIDHDLSHLDDDVQICVDELHSLLREALHVVRRMANGGAIPDDVPRFGGQQVFRVKADLSRVSPTQRTDFLGQYVNDLAESGRLPQTGQNIASEMLDRLRSALNRRTLGIEILKPKGEGETEYMPIDRIAVSGGELLTAAMMIYLVIARLRAEAMHGSAGEAGPLLMDNPLGKANKTLLIKTQLGLADAMGIQLFYTTGIQDINALGEFENVVRARRSARSVNTGLIPVQVIETARAHLDKPGDEPTPIKIGQAAD